MAGRGFSPKDPSKKIDPRDRSGKTGASLTQDGQLRGPDLPNGVLPGNEDWHPRTMDWWLTWRQSAQAQTFTETDWDFLVDTALLHHTMWSKGKWEFAAEVRLRAAKFGATPEDRARLRMTVDTNRTAAKDGSGNVGRVARPRFKVVGGDDA